MTDEKILFRKPLTPRQKKARNTAINHLRTKISERPDSELLWQTIWDFDLQRPNSQRDDRALTLVLGAILEQGLDDAILSHCVPLTETEQKNLFQGGDDAPLAFAPKIRLGYALGIYGPDSKKDIDNVRHIRNLFAHTKTHLTFDDDVVKNMCAQFLWMDSIYWGGGGIIGRKPDTARRIYVETVRHFYIYLSLPSTQGGPRLWQQYEVPELYA